MSESNIPDHRCRLYLITPPRFEPAAFGDLLASALDAGDVGCVQMRLKDASDDEIRRASEVLIPICRDRDVAILLNDRPDLAAALDFDGVHIGQEDMPYKKARQLLGGDGIIGVTCHDSRHLAMEAGEAGADYVGFGAFFPTTTKQAPSQADPDLLRWWSEVMTVPAVAIGGITIANCRPLVEAGADFVAVVAGVWDHPDGPDAAIRAFNQVFDDVALGPDA